VNIFFYSFIFNDDFFMLAAKVHFFIYWLLEYACFDFYLQLNSRVVPRN